MTLLLLLLLLALGPLRELLDGYRWALELQEIGAGIVAVFVVVLIVLAVGLLADAFAKAICGDDD